MDFVGLRVRVARTGGPPIEGTVTAVNERQLHIRTSSNSAAPYLDHGGNRSRDPSAAADGAVVVVVAAAEIADLAVLASAEAAPAPAPAPPAFVDPAIRSAGAVIKTPLVMANSVDPAIRSFGPPAPLSPGRMVPQQFQQQPHGQHVQQPFQPPTLHGHEHVNVNQPSSAFTFQQQAFVAEPAASKQRFRGADLAQAAVQPTDVASGAKGRNAAFASVDLAEVNEDFDFVGSNARFDKAAEFSVLARGLASAASSSGPLESTASSTAARPSAQQRAASSSASPSGRARRSTHASNGDAVVVPKQFTGVGGEPVDGCSAAGRARLLDAMETLCGEASAAVGGDFAAAAAAARSLMFENVAFATAHLVWRKYLQPSVGGRGTGSSIIILVGTGLLGCVGLATARHLSAFGIERVSICRARAYSLPPEHAMQRALNRLVAVGSSGVDANSQSVDSAGRRQFHHPHSGGEVHVGSLPVGTVDVIIDALLGCSCTTPVIEPTATLVRWANGNGAPVVSLDVPSGINSDTGKDRGGADSSVRAALTLAIGAPLTGCKPQAHCVGELWVADAGIPNGVYEALGVRRPAWTPDSDGAIPLHGSRR